MGLSQLPLPCVTRRVEVQFEIGLHLARVVAVMAPAEPEVGILRPYPLALEIRDQRGLEVPVGGEDHVLLVDALRTAYYALEESQCLSPAPTGPC